MKIMVKKTIIGFIQLLILVLISCTENPVAVWNLKEYTKYRLEIVNLKILKQSEGEYTHYPDHSYICRYDTVYNYCWTIESLPGTKNEINDTICSISANQSNFIKYKIKDDTLLSFYLSLNLYDLLDNDIHVETLADISLASLKVFNTDGNITAVLNQNNNIDHIRISQKKSRSTASTNSWNKTSISKVLGFTDSTKIILTISK